MLCKNARLSKSQYAGLQDVINTPAGTKFRLTVQTGRFRKHYSKSDHADALDVIEFLNLPFEKGNDSPRGGKLGDFFTVTDATRGRLSVIVSALGVTK